MIVAKIQVNGAIAHTLYRKVIPAGIIGAQVELEYAEDVWKGLHKTVVFEGAVTKDVVTDAEVVTIPAEVVAKHDDVLRVGVYGVDADGSIAIPTIWAYIGVVCDSANPSGDTTTDPALPVWAQIQTMIGDLRKLDTTAKENLVAAVNEALTKGGGEVDPAEIQRIVDDYLAANPPSVTESDPTVPAWAKQPNKPTYTAEEVHAMPETYTLPIATETTLGGVKPVTATEAMTQPVGVDAEGRLMTKPGSGGSGIAVSGATVGQTVKISAVDDAGVPTAWEAVDFPNGGDDPTGVLELIVDHTVTAEEATAFSLTFTKEAYPLIDGQKFVVVRVVKPTGAAGWWKLKVGNKDIIHFSGSTNVSQVGFAMVTNGIWLADASEGGNMAGGQNLRPCIWVGYKAYREIYTASYDYYDSFTLYSYTTIWPGGTTIEIYGGK